MIRLQHRDIDVIRRVASQEGRQVVVPAVLVLVGGAMGRPADLQPFLHETRERSGRLGFLEPASPGGDIADLHREDAACGIFIRKAMLVELRSIDDPRDRPQLAAPIDRAETLPATSLLPGHVADFAPRK